jgi:hypothetical protein
MMIQQESLVPLRQYETGIVAWHFPSARHFPPQTVCHGATEAYYSDVYLLPYVRYEATPTKDIVTPIIENNASALIIEYSRYEHSPTIALARVQALLLYQSMRQPTYVDRDLPILENWIACLVDHPDGTSA